MEGKLMLFQQSNRALDALLCPVIWVFQTALKDLIQINGLKWLIQFEPWPFRIEYLNVDKLQIEYKG